MYIHRGKKRLQLLLHTLNLGDESAENVATLGQVIDLLRGKTTLLQ